jgi:hypothetical protein
MNSYLKEIADVYKIDKPHLPHRPPYICHFGYLWCADRDSVRVLGYKLLKQMQHYAKIVDRKISQDMAALKREIQHLTSILITGNVIRNLRAPVDSGKNSSPGFIVSGKYHILMLPNIQ